MRWLFDPILVENIVMNTAEGQARLGCPLFGHREFRAGLVLPVDHRIAARVMSPAFSEKERPTPLMRPVLIPPAEKRRKGVLPAAEMAFPDLLLVNHAIAALRRWSSICLAKNTGLCDLRL